MNVLQRTMLAAAILAALAWTPFSGGVLRPLLKETPLAGIPYAISTAINLLDLAAIAAIIVVAGGRQGRGLFALAGLSAPVGAPIVFALALFAPAATIAAAIAPVAQNLNPTDLVFQAAIFPFLEEVGYRGLAVGALMTLGGWRFFPAALAPAAMFGLAHFGQGDAPAEIAGIVALTALGGLLFGWLFVRWGFNLWPAIFVHAGLNALWTVFDLGENALGGWTGNGLRFGVIAGAILLTLAVGRWLPKGAPPPSRAP